jgi:pyridoxamine 5'-phosphate oxidase
MKSPYTITSIDMTDEELLTRFENVRLEAFRHADHLRVAWAYLRRDGEARALAQLLVGLRRYADAKGAPSKFHHTLTRAWLELLTAARDADPTLPTAEAAIRRYPALAEIQLVRRFYTAARLDAEAARTGWVEPDRAPLSLAPDRPLPHDDPFAEFDAAVSRAAAAGIDTTPMTLATADADGRPSARIVLLRGMDRRGFVFHTNYNSRKGRELDANPHAALCFHWPELEEQIRIEGGAGRLPADESDAYFASRPRGHQIGAWASWQSEPLTARDELVRRYDDVEARFADVAVPRPPHWGGFRVDPQRVEFWKGRRDRLHERLVFTRHADAWRHQLLYP